MNNDLPNIDPDLLDMPDLDKLALPAGPEHRPRILLLYGSNRERSYSRLLVQEAARLLEHFGAAYSIRPDCRCRTMHRTAIRRCRSCAS